MNVKLTINPETLQLECLEQTETFTAEQFAALEFPDCPVCGITVTVDRLDVTMNAEDEARNGRSYILGMWDCPRGCDQKTKQKRHDNQEFGKTSNGFSVKCSCGFSRDGLTGPEMTDLLKTHNADT